MVFFWSGLIIYRLPIAPYWMPACSTFQTCALKRPSGCGARWVFWDSCIVNGAITEDFWLAPPHSLVCLSFLPLFCVFVMSSLRVTRPWSPSRRAWLTTSPARQSPGGQLRTNWPTQKWVTAQSLSKSNPLLVGVWVGWGMLSMKICSGDIQQSVDVCTTKANLIEQLKHQKFA